MGKRPKRIEWKSVLFWKRQTDVKAVMGSSRR